MYLFESVYSELKKNTDVMFIDSIVPSCPKHADISCSKDYSLCKEGKSRNCTQRISFYVDSKSLKILYPKFYVYTNRTYSGFLRESDTVLLWLISKKIIDAQNLKKT